MLLQRTAAAVAVAQSSRSGAVLTWLLRNNMNVSETAMLHHQELADLSADRRRACSTNHDSSAEACSWNWGRRLRVHMPFSIWMGLMLSEFFYTCARAREPVGVVYMSFAVHLCSSVALFAESGRDLCERSSGRQHRCLSESSAWFAHTLHATGVAIT